MSEESPPEPSGPPIALIATGVLLVTAMAVGLFVLQAVKDTEGTVEGLIQAGRELLQPRVENALTLQVETLRGSPEAFLVAHHHRGRSQVAASRTIRTILDIPLGTSTVRVGWEWGVDLGVDLAAPQEAFSILCDERARRCVWTVPDPEAREPSVRTDTVRVDAQGAALVFDSVEEAHRDEVLASLTPLTEQRLQDPAFWSTARDDVRRGLEAFAKEALAPSLGDGEDPPELTVRFRSELPGGPG